MTEKTNQTKACHGSSYQEPLSTAASIALWEEALSLANTACWAIELQIKRLASDEPEIDEFILQQVVDFHFLVVAISRLRRAADLACEAADISDQIRHFDSALSGWRKMRNALEHIDDYWRHKGRDESIRVSGLPVFEFGPVIRWLDTALDLDMCRRESFALFQSIKKNPPIVGDKG
jgi:hypothetical protein